MKVDRRGVSLPRRKSHMKAYVQGLEDGLEDMWFDWNNVTPGWLRAYKAGVKRGLDWRAQIESSQEERTAERDAAQAELREFISAYKVWKDATEKRCRLLSSREASDSMLFPDRTFINRIQALIPKREEDMNTEDRTWAVEATKEDTETGNPWVQLAPMGSYGEAEEAPKVGEILHAAAGSDEVEEALERVRFAMAETPQPWSSADLGAALTTAKHPPETEADTPCEGGD